MCEVDDTSNIKRINRNGMLEGCTKLVVLINET